MIKEPPKRAIRFLRWFCREDYLEEIEGNLIELYEKECDASAEQAKRKLYWNVLLHFRPEYLRSLKVNHLNQFSMYKNYFKIAWRSMLKQKLYAFVNIGGLAIGLTCFILIYLYVQHELSYDQFLDNNDRIYRVYQKQPGNEYLGTDRYAFTTVGLAPTMMSDLPEVEHATLLRNQTALLSFDDNHYYEDGLWADPQYFDVFRHPFVQGSPQTALNKAENIVLTQSLAQKLFGNKDPIGQSLVYNDGPTFVVTSVIEDLPSNSSIKFSFLTSMLFNGQYTREMKGDRWNNNDYYTFFTLMEGANLSPLQNKLAAIAEQYLEYPEGYSYRHTYLAQPLSELHFENNMNFDFGIKGNRRSVMLFSLVAVLILLLACANYINLAIARSIKRAGEVGLRKIVGARRGQLVGQFLSESVLIAFLALILALGCTPYFAPLFGYLLERPIELNLVDNLSLIPDLLLLVFLVGLISGSYPAFLMSSLRPVLALKGKIGERVTGVKIQRWLMVGQYAVSIVLIIGSLVIYQQFQFIQNKELGYDRAQVVTISVLDRRLPAQYDELKNEWARNPDILAVTAAAELPTNVTSSTLLRHINASKEEGFNIYRARVYYDYLDVFGLELVSGRDFSESIKTDFEEALVLNETAVKTLGWTPQEAIGKQVRDHKNRTIIGVIKDFHMHSMHLKIAPLMLVMENYRPNFALKVRPDNLQGTIASLEKSVKKFTPYPFQYQFLDDRFNQLYQADLRLGEMFGFFTLLSILIASLGLFGMAAFVASQRTKEIGIRKVLGASVQQIVGLFSKDFLKMVLYGFLFATPIAWYIMQHWLLDFAYRIQLEWWVFALVGLGVLVIAFFTVSSQSLKVALANPVNALKDE